MNKIKTKIKDWLDKGEGGEFYESYVTNRDVLYTMIMVGSLATIIIALCYMI
jgi:hypothetical protein